MVFDIFGVSLLFCLGFKDLLKLSAWSKINLRQLSTSKREQLVLQITRAVKNGGCNAVNTTPLLTVRVKVSCQVITLLSLSDLRHIGLRRACCPAP
jgi:hypothetical protein